MYNLQQRANSVFAFLTTVALSVLFCVACTHPYLLSKATPVASITIKNVTVKSGRVGYYYDYSSPLTELGNVVFDLKADLTSLFNWNTKQLFVYLVAEYTTKSHGTNQMVLWDDIIQTWEDADILVRNKKSEYMASDIKNKLTGIQAKVSLHWNIIPHVGLLYYNAAGITPLKFVKEA